MRENKITLVLAGTQIDLLLFLRVLVMVIKRDWSADDEKINIYMPEGFVSDLYSLCSLIHNVTTYKGRNLESLGTELEEKGENYVYFDTSLAENRITRGRRHHLTDAFLRAFQFEILAHQRISFPMLMFPMNEGSEGFYTSQIIRRRFETHPPEGSHIFVHFCEAYAPEEDKHWGTINWSDLIVRTIQATHKPWITSSLLISNAYKRQMEKICYVEKHESVMQLLRCLANSNLFIGPESLASHLAVALHIPSLIFFPIGKDSNLYQHRVFWTHYMSDPFSMLMVQDVLTNISPASRIYNHIR